LTYLYALPDAMVHTYGGNGEKRCLAKIEKVVSFCGWVVVVGRRILTSVSFVF